MMAVLWSLVLLCGAVLTLHVHCWDCVAEHGLDIQGWRSNMSFYSMYKALYTELMEPCRGAGDAPQSTRPTSRSRSRSRSRSPAGSGESPGRGGESRRRSNTSHGTSNSEELESACCTMQIMLEFDLSVSLDRFKSVNKLWQKAHGGKVLIDPFVAFTKLRPTQADMPSTGPPNASLTPWAEAKRSMTRDLFDIIPHLAVVVDTSEKATMSNDVETALKYYIDKSKPSARIHLDCVAGYAKQMLGLNTEQAFYRQHGDVCQKVMDICRPGDGFEGKPKLTAEQKEHTAALFFRDGKELVPRRKGFFPRRGDFFKVSDIQKFDSACCTTQIMLQFNPTESVAVYEYVNKLWRADYGVGLLDPLTALNELLEVASYNEIGFSTGCTWSDGHWRQMTIETYGNDEFIPYIAKETSNTLDAEDVTDALNHFKTDLKWYNGIPRRGGA